MALRLAQAGARVVVLEKGPWYREADFSHDEIETCRRDFFVPFVSDEPHLRPGPDGRPRKSNFGWTAHCVGGGTVHWSGFVHRLHPEDFALARRYGRLEDATLADWPITYRTLAPYYDVAEREIGVSGKAGTYPNEPPRAGPYPLPPVLENPLSSLIDRGAKKLGLHPFVTPRAILSQPYQGRKACAYCDFCGSYGCETGAKGSTAAALIPRAVATGRCEVRPHAMAFEVASGKDGRVTGVRYYDASGQAVMQRARFVVVSCTAIESARLLLNSKSARHPNGLANGSGLVGKNLTFSTLAKVYGVFERAKLPEALRPRHKIHFLQRSVQDFYFLEEKKGGYDKGGTLNFILPHRNPIFTADRLSKRHRPRLWGEALYAELRRYYDEVHEIECEVFGEYLPSPRSEVRVDGEVKDRFGIPVATVRAEVHPLDYANVQLLAAKAEEVLRAAGAQKVGYESVGGITDVLQHGTCRFGDDPAASVLDRNCRAHEVDNLYVVDGSFMPTSGGVPTTLTILANSFRVADHLVRRLKGKRDP
ncbi:MAG: GMC family oxidoreductase [Deltaproteobacteria bacterium]|nr:MAG: GMC family oxidoreductase [Deltaproteobacteria bacterium]